MRSRPLTAAALAAAFALAAPSGAQQWSLHVGTGVAYNLPLPLTIEQAGAFDLSLTARWHTRPFATPLYYVARVERESRGGASWGLELVHHKLFLQNLPPEVQRFEITHGFNVLTAQRGWALRRGFGARVGAGVIVAHPENEVRSRKVPTGGWGNRGYYVAGPSALVGGGWSLALTESTRIGLEAKLIGAHASVPVAYGTARLWNASGHLQLVASQAF